MAESQLVLADKQDSSATHRQRFPVLNHPRCTCSPWDLENLADRAKAHVSPSLFGYLRSRWLSTGSSLPRRDSRLVNTWLSNSLRTTASRRRRISATTLNRSCRWVLDPGPDATKPPIAWRLPGGSSSSSYDPKGLPRMLPEHGSRTSNSQYELRLCLATNCGCGGQV